MNMIDDYFLNGDYVNNEKETTFSLSPFPMYVPIPIHLNPIQFLPTSLTCPFPLNPAQTSSINLLDPFSKNPPVSLLLNSVEILPNNSTNTFHLNQQKISPMNPPVPFPLNPPLTSPNILTNRFPLNQQKIPFTTHIPDSFPMNPTVRFPMNPPTIQPIFNHSNTNFSPKPLPTDPTIRANLISLSKTPRFLPNNTGNSNKIIQKIVLNNTNRNNPRIFNNQFNSINKIPNICPINNNYMPPQTLLLTFPNLQINPSNNNPVRFSRSVGSSLPRRTTISNRFINRPIGTMRIKPTININTRAISNLRNNLMNNTNFNTPTQRTNNFFRNSSLRSHSSKSSKKSSGSGNSINSRQSACSTDSRIMAINDLPSFTEEYLVNECKCSHSDFEYSLNFYYDDNYMGRSIVGGEIYKPPIGWSSIALKVKGVYYNDDWLANDGRPGEWAIAYHGFGRSSNRQELKRLVKNVINNNLRPGENQMCKDDPDVRHPGMSCGVGVYVTPDISVAQQYAGKVEFGDQDFYIAFMVRVNPSAIRESANNNYYWIVNGNTSEIRPYKVLFKAVNPIY